MPKEDFFSYLERMEKKIIQEKVDNYFLSRMEKEEKNNSMVVVLTISDFRNLLKLAKNNVH